MRDVSFDGTGQERIGRRQRESAFVSDFAERANQAPGAEVVGPGLLCLFVGRNKVVAGGRVAVSRDFLGVVLILRSPERARFGDRVAGTRVVYREGV